MDHADNNPVSWLISLHFNHLFHIWGLYNDQIIMMFHILKAFERINASFYQIVEWTQDMKDKLEGLKHR